MKSRATAGMTMVELLLALVVIGMLAAIGLPRIARTLQSTSAQGAATTVAADMEAAFATAARSRRPVVVSCDCTNRSYRVADQTGGTVRLERRLDNSSGMAVDQIALTPNSAIVIGPNGIATNTFEIRLTVGASQRVVSVGRTGQVRITR